MNSFTLNNGITMPALGFGTFKMNGEECAQSVAEAIRCGYRMIDTAEAYKNEEAVGAGIAEGGVPRGELFIVTKVNFRSYPKTRETVEAEKAAHGLPRPRAAPLAARRLLRRVARARKAIRRRRRARNRRIEL